MRARTDPTFAKTLGVLGAITLLQLAARAAAWQAERRMRDAVAELERRAASFVPPG